MSAVGKEGHKMGKSKDKLGLQGIMELMLMSHHHLQASNIDDEGYVQKKLVPFFMDLNMHQN